MFGVKTTSHSNSEKAILRTLIKTNGFDYVTYNGSVFTFNKPLSLTGKVYLMSESTTLRIYLNGILSDNSFQITKTGKLFEFNYKEDAAMYTNPVTLQFEVIEN